MNLYVTAAVKELKEKLNAYLSLLSYRYANLCVKAELGALLPVTVVAEREYNLEDVAKVATPDDFRFEIYLSSLPSSTYIPSLRWNWCGKTMATATSISSIRCPRSIKTVVNS